MDFRDFPLETFIRMGLKDDLIDACEYLQVDYRKSWNKTKLSGALAKTYREDPVKLFFTLPHEGMEFLSRLMKGKCTMVIDSSKKSYKPQNPRDFMDTLEILEFFGLIFIDEIPGSYEESISVTTPYEVKKIMAPFLTKERREAAKYMDLVADLVRGALYYYGAMRVSKLIETIQEKLPDLSEDVCYMVLTYRVTLRDYIHFDEMKGVEYVFRNIYDPEDEELERKEEEELLRRISVRTDIDYKTFGIEDLLMASMEGFVEDVESYQLVADAFREHYLPTEALLEHVEGAGEDEGLIEEEYRMFMRAMVEEVRRTGDSTYALKMIGRCMNFTTKEAMEKAIPLLMNFLNSISRYELKGHSPLELGRSFNGGGGNVVPFRREKAIGRNDPCPCGSGKKYKDCHGSRKNPLN